LGDHALYRIVYLSRATRTFDDAELNALAAWSAERNAVASVTGLLLYDGSRFLQAIEGPEAQVTGTMDRIARDKRHDSLTYIQDDPVRDRQFGHWAMQLKLAPAGCCSTDFLERVKEDVTLVDDLNLQAAFIGFAVLSSQRPRGYTCANR